MFLNSPRLITFTILKIKSYKKNYFVKINLTNNQLDYNEVKFLF